MSERGKRVVRVLLDRERDADVVERIERQGSITGYLRTLVRRDIHDERIDYAAMKAAELQAENAKLRKELAVTNPLFETLNAANDRLIYENMKLRELVRDMYKAFMHGNCYRWCEFKEPCNYISDGRCQWYERAHDLGVEI